MPINPLKTSFCTQITKDQYFGAYARHVKKLQWPNGMHFELRVKRSGLKC